jgi:hypothetical protein
MDSWHQVDSDRFDFHPLMPALTRVSQLERYLAFKIGTPRRLLVVWHIADNPCRISKKHVLAIEISNKVYPLLLSQASKISPNVNWDLRNAGSPGI